jgi:hypothetical protein
MKLVILTALICSLGACKAFISISENGSQAKPSSIAFTLQPATEIVERLSTQASVSIFNHLNQISSSHPNDWKIVLELV